MEEDSSSDEDEEAAAEMASKGPRAAPPAAGQGEARKVPEKGTKKGKSAISPRWSALIGLSARPFKGPDRPGQAHEMSSLAEGKTRKVSPRPGPGARGTREARASRRALAA